MTEKKNKNNMTKYVHLTGLGFQMMAVMFVFIWLGRWVDEHYAGERKYFAALGSLLGLAASLYLVLKQLKNVK
ncbi:MAG: AtpZ/AtpI family protein [Weeksellaceae bacterium]|jgi:F0F1-type ATP synthase assembly protein I|nr:AtpZ/AtpI family protein [Weeksellaceae bacterium]MDX9705679.1 AtpZ/AtpI family protein [Weeksellaceae bacterium]